MNKFISFIYFHDYILGFTEWGDVYKYIPQTDTWTFISTGPMRQQ